MKGKGENRVMEYKSCEKRGVWGEEGEQPRVGRRSGDGL